MRQAIVSSERARAVTPDLPAWSRAAVGGGTLLLVVWGALAFGAVYPWAYQPLVVGCVIVGAGAWLAAGARSRIDPQVRRVVVSLSFVMAGALFQLVPFDPPVRARISPASEAYLRSTDIAYAAAVAIQQDGKDALAGAIPSARRPLTIDPAGTRRGLLFAAAFTILLAGLTHFFGRAGLGRMPGALTCFGVVLALVGIGQKAVLGDHAYGGMLIYGFWRPDYLLSTPFGPYVNKNHFAGWMVMGLPLAIGYFFALASVALRRVRPDWLTRLLWLSSSHGARLQFALFAILVMAVSLAMTRSRSGIACFAVAVGVAAMTASRWTYSRGARIAVVAALGMLLVLPFTWAGADLSTRFSTDSGSIQLRKDAWQATLRIIRDYPLTGTGLNTYGTATLQYRPDRPTQHFQEAHNDYLQLLAEGGLLLVIPSLAALCFLARGVRLRFRERRDDTMRYWLRVGAATSLMAIALQSLVEFSLQMPGNAVFFVVLCAIALHRSPDSADGDRLHPSRERRTTSPEHERPHAWSTSRVG